MDQLTENRPWPEVGIEEVSSKRSLDSFRLVDDSPTVGLGQCGVSRTSAPL